MKSETIHISIENLQETTGIQAYWQENGQFDGRLEMNIDERLYSFLVVVKNEIRSHQIYPLEQLRQEHKNLLVVAQHIFPKVKEEMRHKKMAYLEANGNFFLHDKDIFFLIDTQKNSPITKEKGNRAFTKTGLKVLFHLLQYKEDIQKTQRVLAEKVGVALGTIPQVIEGLKETGYLIPLNSKEYVWEHRRDLLEKWVTGYGTILKPKLKKETYTYRGNWEEISLNKEKSIWGGEPAADILTDYLRPEKWILYTKESRVSLMKNYRLMPQENGEIEVFELFWKHDVLQTTVPPLLVYADLLLEGGKRNKETAQRIFDEYIEPNL